MTFGEKAVGLSFNPSGDDEVAKVKRLYADIIDHLHNARTQQGVTAGSYRYYSTAITEAQTAQMWAVKAITWRDEV